MSLITAMIIVYAAGYFAASFSILGIWVVWYDNRKEKKDDTLG